MHHHNIMDKIIDFKNSILSDIDKYLDILQNRPNDPKDNTLKVLDMVMSYYYKMHQLYACVHSDDDHESSQDQISDLNVSHDEYCSPNSSYSDTSSVILSDDQYLDIFHDRIYSGTSTNEPTNYNKISDQVLYDNTDINTSIDSVLDQFDKMTSNDVRISDNNIKVSSNDFLENYKKNSIIPLIECIDTHLTN